MRLTPPVTDVTLYEGFTPEKDIFERKHLGVRLAHLMEHISEPIIGVLDAPWGSGKTTFARMLHGHLHQQGFPVIYFDAFANDYINDPFLAIIGEIIGLAEKKAQKLGHQRKLLKEKAIAVSKIVARIGIKLGVKALTLGVMNASDLDDLGKISEEGADVIATTVDDYIRKILEDQIGERQLFFEFRCILSKIATDLSDNAEEGSRRPLVFIIDELDRCKPSFSLGLLETIKHFFSVENVHFLMVTHLSQLENSVKFQYGANIDAMNYLHKFYNILVTLPDVPSNGPTNNLRARYINYIFSDISDDSERGNFAHSLASFLIPVACNCGMTLRTIERVYTNINLVLLCSNERYLRIPELLIVLASLKVLDINIYNRIRNKVCNVVEIDQIFHFDAWPSPHHAPAGRRMSMWLAYCLRKDIDVNGDEWRAYTQFMFKYSIEREQILPAMCSILDEFKFVGATDLI